jgi:hypothetical protein
MINVAQITAQLAKLPDQQLQQYAMMHKSDPYIMALAVSEANRRKRLRASTNAGPAQESPKVADQAVAAMAPQSPGESGIAALPAGDMNFADGGIVAFADGGDVPRFNGSQSQFVQDIMGIPQQYTEYQQRIREEDARRAESDRRMAEAKRQRLEAQQKTSFANYLFGSPEREAEGKAELAQLSTTSVGAPARSGSMPEQGYTRPGMLYDPRLNTQAAAAPSVGAAPKAKSAPEAGLGGTREAAALRGTPGIAAPSAQGAKGVAGQFLDTKGLHADLDKFYADEQAAVNAARKRQSEGKPEGKAYSKLEEALQAEEGRAGKEKSEAQGVAIFKAGLAMMAGTSRNAFENIGKGAMAGLEEYSGAIKDMKKAAKERQKALADIDNARRAEARDDWKAVQAFEERADARMSKAREFGIKSIMDITGKDAEISSKIYTTQVEQQGALQRTNIQAGTTLQAARIGADARGAGAESKEVAAAEAAFARDPQAKALSESLKMQAFSPNSPAYQLTLQKLQAIQAAKYRQFGLTLEGAPGAQSSSGTNQQGWSIKPLQ